MPHEAIVFAALLAMMLAACAARVPRELVDARAAYDRASRGQATKRAPADLHKAKSALDKAEQSFVSDPRGRATRNLAYVAQRKSQLAEVTASRASEVNSKVVLGPVN
jgi:hypothetical protein